MPIALSTQMLAVGRAGTGAVDVFLRHP